MLGHRDQSSASSTTATCNSFLPAFPSVLAAKLPAGGVMSAAADCLLTSAPQLLATACGCRRLQWLQPVLMGLRLLLHSGSLTALPACALLVTLSELDRLDGVLLQAVAERGVEDLVLQRARQHGHENAQRDPPERQ